MVEEQSNCPDPQVLLVCHYCWADMLFRQNRCCGGYDCLEFRLLMNRHL